MNQLDYGLLAEFDDADSLVSAARRLTELGYRRVDAHTPFPVDGLADALGQRTTRIPLVVLIGGILGGITGYALQWWASVIAYPLNIGGRPLNSWPAFVPITFELTILVAALFAVAGMLALNGLPQPHHPLFSIDAFRRASSHGYFLSVEADDPRFAESDTRLLLAELRAREVWLVPRD